MVRLPEPIEFEKVTSRKKQAAPVAATRKLPARKCTKAPMHPPPPKPQEQPGREKSQFLGEPKHNEILVSLADVRI
jgi:hypothetical protein